MTTLTLLSVYIISGILSWYFIRTCLKCSVPQKNPNLGDVLVVIIPGVNTFVGVCGCIVLFVVFLGNLPSPNYKKFFNL